MANYFRLPFALPFKFVPNAGTGIHFDDKWAVEQIQAYETRLRYAQKWVRTDTTMLQCESSIYPQPLSLYRCDGSIAKAIEWQRVYEGVQYSVYELLWDVSDLEPGLYVPYQVVQLLGITWQAIGEPIAIADSWPGTLLFTYRNTVNDFDVAFTTGITFKFRCEATLPPEDMRPGRERATMVSQTHDVKTLSGTPYRTFKLYIGGNPTAKDISVPPYIIDVLNRIFLCDTVSVQGKRFEMEPDSKIEVQQIKQYAQLTAELSLMEAFNNMSLEFVNLDEIAPGIVTAYNIETAFFGPGTLIPITDIEQQ